MSGKESRSNFKKRAGSYGKNLFRAIAGIFLLILYVIFWNSNARNEICLRRYRFLALTVIYAALSAALLFWNIWMPAVWNKLDVRIKKGLCVLLWAMAPALFYLTTEIACNENWKTVAWNYAGYNYLIYLFCGIELALILGSDCAAFTLMEATSLLYGIASHYILEFKNTTLRPGELLGARTGLAVAGGYSYTLTNNIVKAILLGMLTWVLILFLTKNNQAKVKKLKRVRRLAIRLSLAVGGAVLLYAGFQKINISEQTGVSIYAWKTGNTYGEAGSALCFLIDIQEMRIDKPEGYSTEKAEEILAQYNSKTPEEQTVKPDIIVIMNESFSDPSVIGPFESDDYLSNFNSVTDYMLKGYAYVSVYGGGTCNSEFEFLTGSTMGFLGSNCYPYQIFQFDGFTSMAGVFSDLGYKTIAMHPSTATNWNREHVYSQMGFDEFISNSNGFADAVKWRGSWIDDESDYKELIRQVDTAEQPLFLFNVTVQNHSEYTTSKLTDKELVTIEDQYSEYDNVIAYLTGIKYSDMALGELIQYFRDSDNPVILCFFGDHQGTLNQDFINAISAANTDAAESNDIERGQALFKVPYLIWSNYLEPGQTELDLSLNYLSAWLLKYANALTPYGEYLLELQETIQAVNSKGYMKSGTWYSLEEPDESLNNYAIVQYYRLFGKN